ncbi:hypothetical protein SLE2022_327220 [Rubroshorea leprosula]|uniref:RRM domain-containing protein n=1 Tax=Rubroshorea leprosula TaxID=152421 RepID=A0AAV5JCX1_9ROSI|nr:hypothetical protein SLEP1_g20752 [Rubroshorea leprosula]
MSNSKRKSSSGKTECTVYVGNLDERVTDRVLYDILIQAGRIFDLHIPRDRDTGKPKGFAFAEYETEEIANYAVKLFSGLVTLYNRTLKFGISGQDKQPSQTPQSESAVTPSSNSSHQSRPGTVPVNGKEASEHSMRLSTSSGVSAYPSHYGSPYHEVPPPPGVTHHSNGYGSQYNGYNYENSRSVFGPRLDSISRTRSFRYETRNPISYPY